MTESNSERSQEVIQKVRSRKGRLHSADYKYTGEWMFYAGILESEEELNN